MTLAKHAFYAVAIAVLCNVRAQVALKMGATTEVTRLQTWLSPAILIMADISRSA